jgi:hypothetical protein
VTTAWSGLDDPRPQRGVGSRAGSVRARDAGLTRLSRLTKATAAAAVALTGLISGIAADARPGHAKPRHVTAGDAGRPAVTTPTPAPSPSGSAQDGADPRAGLGDSSVPAPSSGAGDGGGSDQGSEQPSLEPPASPPEPTGSGGGAVSGGS